VERPAWRQLSSRPLFSPFTGACWVPRVPFARRYFLCTTSDGADRPATLLAVISLRPAICCWCYHAARTFTIAIGPSTKIRIASDAHAQSALPAPNTTHLATSPAPLTISFCHWLIHPSLAVRFYRAVPISAAKTFVHCVFEDQRDPS
jgi:hypothetical protein